MTASLGGTHETTVEKHIAWSSNETFFVYRMLTILEGLYVHFIQGTASNPAAEFEMRVPSLVQPAHMVIDEG